MGRVTLLYNCTILRDHELKKNDLWIQDGRIIDAASVEYACDEAVDCGGSLISPGFIDLKINGGFGVDFSGIPVDSTDPSREVEFVASKLPSTGVTSFCPTILTSSEEYYKRVLADIRTDGRSPASKRANILGVHLDGPFIAKTRAGAHPVDLIKQFSSDNEDGKSENDGAEMSPFETLKRVYGGNLEGVAMITLAPELPGATEVIRHLSRWDIKVSLGHSACTLNDGLVAVEAGACMLTHLFNAMPSFHHRDPSLVGLIASDLPNNKVVRFGIIADGVHTHPAAVRMAYRIAPKSLFLVTDGVGPLGLGCGEFEVNNRTVTVVEDESGSPTCKVSGTDILCGGVATMDACIRHFKRFTGCSTVYALEAATLNPAIALGINDRKGTLAIGADADFVFLDPKDLTVRATYVRGECVYTKEVA